MKTKRNKKQDLEAIKTATATDVNTAWLKGYIAGVESAMQPPERIAMIQKQVHDIIRNKSQD